MENTIRKILFVTNSTDPYWVDYFSDPRTQEKYDLRVLFLRKPDLSANSWKKETLKFEHGFVSDSSRCGVRQAWKGFWAKKFFLKEFKPEVVVCCGYNHFFHVLLAFYCLVCRIPMVMRSDSNVLAEKQKSFFLKTVKRVYLGFWVSFLKGVWVAGTMNERYWRQYGVPANKIIQGGFFPVKVERFIASSVTVLSPGFESSIRLPDFQDLKIFLWVGRFVSQKGLKLLLEAFKPLQAEAGLLLVGSGPLKEELLKFVSREKIQNVFMPGPLANSDLPSVYSKAYAYIQPSVFEPCGIVIHEALLSGTPVIASDVCGYAYEMLVDGVNGLRFKSGDSEDLYLKMKHMLRDQNFYAQAKTKSREIAQAWSYEEIYRATDVMLEKICEDRA